MRNDRLDQTVAAICDRRRGARASLHSTQGKLRPCGSCTGRAWSNDRGVALILVMLSMLILTVLAATIVFTARAETFASQNYKLDTQADYLAKAGIQRAANWFRSNHYRAVSETEANTYYHVNSTGAPYNLYTSGDSSYSGSPVYCKSGCSTDDAIVQLVGYGNGIQGSSSSNYPTAITNAAGTDIPTSFAADLANSSNTRISGDTANSGYFKVTATLIYYQTVNVQPAPSPMPAACVPNASVVTCPVETWLITSKAYWTGTDSSTSTVAAAEETAIIQPIFWPTWGNALYGFCSVSMTGSAGTCTDAFNSSLGAYAGGNTSAASGLCNQTTYNNVISTGAGVGSNGGVTLGSNVTVAGNVTIGNSPSTGCTATSGCQLQGGGACTSNQVLGEVFNGPHINPPAIPIFPTGFPTGATVVPNITGTNVQKIPDTVAWPGTTPTTWPYPSPSSGAPPLASSATYCMSGMTCNGSAPDPTTGQGPYLIKSISMTGGTLDIVGGTDALHPVYYDIACISQTGGSIVLSGYVVLNVLGTASNPGGCNTNGMTLAGNGISNGIATDIPPMALQINYAGSNGVNIAGNGAISAVITAPNADVTLGGAGANGYMVGSIEANNVTVSGGYPIHYDTQLSKVGGSLGTVVSTAYGRKKM